MDGRQNHEKQQGKKKMRVGRDEDVTVFRVPARASSEAPSSLPRPFHPHLYNNISPLHLASLLSPHLFPRRVGLHNLQ
jgi:hypothetical protein